MKNQDDRSNKPERFRVVMVGLTAEKAKYAVIKVLATDLSISFAEAKAMVEHPPSEIVSGIPEEAADLLETRLRQVGAIIEVLPEDIKGVSYCETHPNIQARAKCRSCERLICGTCILKAQRQFLCPDCFADLRRSARIRLSRQITIGIIGLMTLLYGGHIILNRVQRLSGAYTLRVLIVELTQSSDETFQNLTLTINTPPLEAEKTPSYTLGNLDQWFQNQYLHFHPYQHNFSFLKTRIAGPFLVSEEPPLISEDAGRITRFIENRRIAHYLENIAEEHFLDLDIYDIKIFLFFHTKEAQFYGSRTGGSQFANLALIYFPVHTATPSFYLAQVLHEIGRLMGATPKYTQVAGRTSIFPSGYADPYKTPLYPQHFAELMSGTIPTKEGIESSVTSLSQIHIGHATAYELGWISQDDYERFYRLK